MLSSNNAFLLLTHMKNSRASQEWLLLTSLLCFDLQDVRGWSVTYGGEAQHPEAVGDVRRQARDGCQAAVVSVVLLPGAQRGRHVGAVVNPVASYLSVGLLWWLPLNQHGASAQHARLNVERRRRGRLLASARLHGVAGRPAADVVDGHDAELVLGVRAESADAVARGCHALHLLEAVVRQLGSVLDHVVGNGFWVSGVPRQRHAGGGGLRHSQGGRGFR